MNEDIKAKAINKVYNLCKDKFLCGKVSVVEGFVEKDIAIEVRGEGYMSFNNEIINELSQMCNRIYFSIETESKGCEHCERESNMTLTISLESFKF